MSTMLQTGTLATDGLQLLSYVQHMAQTAQPAAAKRMFELFAKQETRRIKANGQCRADPDCAEPTPSDQGSLTR